MTAVASIFLIGILSCITVATFAWSKRYGNDRIIQLLKHLTKRLTEIVKDKKGTIFYVNNLMGSTDEVNMNLIEH